MTKIIDRIKLFFLLFAASVVALTGVAFVLALRAIPLVIAVVIIVYVLKWLGVLSW